MLAQLDSDYIKMFPRATFTRLVSYAMFEGRPVTTRGQWINPLVRVQAKLASRVGEGSGVESPAFIVGLGRSGTTVLGSLLSVHPEVGFLNEPKLIWNLIHPGEDVIGSYSRGSAHYRLDARDASVVAARRARRIFSTYLRCVGRRRLVDKYPEHVFRIPFVQALFPDARFVGLLRDGDSVVSSISRWSERFSKVVKGERHDWWGIADRKWKLMTRQILEPDPVLGPIVRELGRIDDPRERAALEWIATTEEMLRRECLDPQRLLLVHYEDLAQRPRHVLPRVLRHILAGESEDLIRYAEARLVAPAKVEAPELRPEIRLAFDATAERVRRHREILTCE